MLDSLKSAVGLISEVVGLPTTIFEWIISGEVDTSNITHLNKTLNDTLILNNVTENLTNAVEMIQQNTSLSSHLVGPSTNSSHAIQLYVPRVNVSASPVREVLLSQSASSTALVLPSESSSDYSLGGLLKMVPWSVLAWKVGSLGYRKMIEPAMKEKLQEKINKYFPNWTLEQKEKLQGELGQVLLKILKSTKLIDDKGLKHREGEKWDKWIEIMGNIITNPKLLAPTTIQALTKLPTLVNQKTFLKAFQTLSGPSSSSVVPEPVKAKPGLEEIRSILKPNLLALVKSEPKLIALISNLNGKALYYINQYSSDMFRQFIEQMKKEDLKCDSSRSTCKGLKNLSANEQADYIKAFAKIKFKVELNEPQTSPVFSSSSSSFR